MNVGAIHPLKSGGVLVDVGEAFPVWRSDMGAARRLLLERDLMLAEIRTASATDAVTAGASA